MFCKEMHPLLLECFITFLRCVRMTGRAFDDICMTLMVHITSFLLKITLKFHAKNNRFWAHSQHRKWDGILQVETQSLLLECFITILRCIRMVGAASDSLYNLTMAHTVSFLPNISIQSQCSCKISDLGHPLSIWEMGRCAAKRDIYWCLSVFLTILRCIRMII